MSFYNRQPGPAADALALLREANLFRELADPQLQEVAGRMIRRKFISGVTLFHQGMPGLMMYLIEKGSVRVFAVGIGGQEYTLNTFGKGSAFGELAVIDGDTRTASAITLEDTTVWLLSKQDFEDLLDRVPGLCRAVTRMLAGRVRQAAARVENVVFQDVVGRLASEALNLAEKHGIETEGGLEIRLPLTQSDLATIVGARRETVNKALAHLRNQGLLDMEGNTLRLLDLGGLLAVVEQRG